MGLTAGPVPARVDASVKAGVLELIDHAVSCGWSARAACDALGVDHMRAARWAERRDADRLEDLPPGGHPVHGLLDWERAAIVALHAQWGERDRSHRKLAHRGSYLERVWVSESTVRKVLSEEGLVLPGNPPREPIPRTPWPDWLEWKPNRVWGYDFTHFTRAKRCAVAIIDIVSRKWITTLVSAEESSIQVEVAFTEALEVEDLWAAADQRATAALVTALSDPDRDAAAECPHALARPKSVSFTSPATLRRMFAGFTSRWMTPWLCAYATASQATRKCRKSASRFVEELKAAA